MKTITNKFGKILVLLLACLSIGMVTSAANAATTEVQIAIEAAEKKTEDDGNDVGGTEEDSSGNVETEQREHVENVEQVQTGDSSKAWVYIAVAGMMVVLVGICILKKKRTGWMAVFAFFLSLFLMNHSVYATEETQNVNVTVPSSISVSFNKSGDNTISEFSIDNSLPVPVTIDKVTVTECNTWELCEAGEDIPVNTKRMAFTFENQHLKAEENILGIDIPEGSSKKCDLHIDRGAWTIAGTAEKALKLEFEYTIGKKQFRLNFDTNGGTPVIPSQMVYNGETVTLPSVKKEGYELAGWEDSGGNLYTDKFIMPMQDVTLTAKWRETTAYAIYVREDSSLRFIRSADNIIAGSIYNDMTVTAVYSGFENKTFSSVEQVPWYDNNYYINTIVKRVIVEDKIQPVNTAYWFNFMYDCEYFDLEKLDTSKVTDMSYMFAWAGFDAPTLSIKGVDNFDVSNVKRMPYTFAYTGRNSNSVIVDLSRWNVSNVTNMSDMFAGMGYLANTFSVGDLSAWNVSNVTNMYSMFQQTGYAAHWLLDCSKWDVSKVTSYNNFDFQVDAKVIDPYWKH